MALRTFYHSKRKDNKGLDQDIGSHGIQPPVCGSMELRLMMVLLHSGMGTPRHPYPRSPSAALRGLVPHTVTVLGRGYLSSRWTHTGGHGTGPCAALTLGRKMVHPLCARPWRPIQCVTSYSTRHTSRGSQPHSLSLIFYAVTKSGLAEAPFSH